MPKTFFYISVFTKQNSRIRVWRGKSGFARKFVQNFINFALQCPVYNWILLHCICILLRCALVFSQSVIFRLDSLFLLDFPLSLCDPKQPLIYQILQLISVHCSSKYYIILKLNCNVIICFNYTPTTRHYQQPDNLDLTEVN